MSEGDEGDDVPVSSHGPFPPEADCLAWDLMVAGSIDLRALVARMANRVATRTEANVQSDLHTLLTTAPLGLSPDELESITLESPAGQRRRIDVEVGCTVFEVKKDLRVGNVRFDAVEQLAGYVRQRTETLNQRYVGVLTDGAEWHVYHLAGGELHPVASLTLDPASPEVDDLIVWLEGVLATVDRITPSPREITRRLGASSPSHALDAAELASLYATYRDLPTVKVKRGLWAKLLTTALGTNFADEDDLFVDHTLLVAMAEVISHAVVGFHPEDPSVSAATLMSGALFTRAQIAGVVEADFFDWIVEVPGGDRFVKSLARRLARFAWDQVEHDVMKVLYESVISAETRHRLGEYYTPDWLAEEIVAACVDDPLDQRVLDASCGSGTFVFHAVRRYLEAAAGAGVSNADAIRGVSASVIGVDVHPVAVTLARVTYLLAIGMERLRADDRPPFAVPVYLGDSLQWGQETTLLTHDGLTVSTADGAQLFADELRFPDAVVADAARFDRLVSELADKAANRSPGSPVPSLASTFRLFAVAPEDQPVVERTFRTMCELHDQGRDHIWGYYVRNLARPMWLARPEHRVDVLVGNPPWLAYRYMTAEMQAAFRSMSSERQLWAGASVATNQDLSGLFVARCVELYLRPGGRFGYVMPWGTLSRRQYAGFRTGHYPGKVQPVDIAFDQPWDLHQVKPAFFPVPSSVVFGQRAQVPAPLVQEPEVWSGRFATASATRAEATPHLNRAAGVAASAGGKISPYAERFAQGATVVPRMLFLVEPEEASPLGAGAGRRVVRSLRSPNEKKPWKTLQPLRGSIEQQFLHPLIVGDTVLPFRVRDPMLAVVPWDGKRLLHGADERLDLYPGLATWWREAEAVWMQNRSSDRLNLVERLDYRRGVSQQFPAPEHRVVYNSSGVYLAAAVITNPSAVIDTKLYWCSASGRDEALFLMGLLNSEVVTLAVRPLQSRGEHNPRDFHKFVFQLALPLFDPANPDHLRLVELAERAERVAADVDLPPVRFEALRRRVREALVEDGVSADIDGIVGRLIAAPSA